MKDLVATYLAAVLLSLAQLWSGPPSPRALQLAQPGLVRVFQGVRVTTTAVGNANGEVRFGLLLEERLWLSLVDPHAALFPGTMRCAGLETPVAVPN